MIPRTACAAAFGLVLLAAPVVAAAQPATNVPRIGYLQGSLAANPQLQAGFLQGLRDLDYVDGRNIVIEYRDAEGPYERFPALAADLVARKVDIIIVTNTPAALAAKQATRNIPIVATAANPVGSGLIKSLARPGGNVTGLSALAPELVGKRLELLKQAVPGASRIAVLWHRGGFSETHRPGDVERGGGRGSGPGGAAARRRGAQCARLRPRLRGHDQGARGCGHRAVDRHLPPREMALRGSRRPAPANR